MAIYVKWDGIKGNVTAKGYPDHMAINSFAFGLARGITMEAGNMSNREANRPSIREVTISKPADNSATAIFKESVSGSAGKKLTFKFVQTGADKIHEFMTYDLEDVLVSGYSISADAEGDPIETISLSFSKIMVKYNDFDKSNKSASPQRVGYDLTSGRAL